MNEPPDPGGTLSPLPPCYSPLSPINYDSDPPQESQNSKAAKTGKKRRSSSPVENTARPRSPLPTGANNAQITHTSTNSPVGRTDYCSKDAGPFTLHVQRIEESPSSGATLHPVNFGHFLHKNKVSGIVQGSIKSIGRNRITLNFSSATQANTFKTSPILPKYGYKAFIPSFSVTKMGLVRGIPAEWSPEEIIQYVSFPGNYSCPILKVRRLNFKTMVDGKPIWKPSQTVVLTFDGQSLPSKIFVFYNALPVEQYIYPTIQCFKCCRFGHTKLQCRSKPRCFKCGDDHSAESCSVDEGRAFCISCRGCHFATNRKVCPEFSRQTSIKTAMAEKAISYSEASKLHAPVSRSFADVAKASPSSRPVGSSQSRVQVPNSYKKTVTLKPRVPPQLGRGYDRASHLALISEPSSQTQNGCALSHNQAPVNASTDKIIQLLISLISMISSNSVPSNVAPILNNLFHTSNGSTGENPSVELSER